MSDLESYEELINSVSDADVRAAAEQLGRELDATSTLAELRDVFRSRGVSLVLGAGVSASCGAPSWAELLLRLHQRSALTRLTVDLSGLTNIYAQAVAGDGPLIAARLAVGELREDDDTFRTRIREEIYRSLNTQRSALVTSLGRLAQIAEDRRGVLSVLTYNYDILLEEEFEAIERRFRRVDRTERSDGSGLPVRHVHGFLGRVPLPREWVILTEQAYHAEYSNPFSWSNIVQLNAFRESSCLFVGLSMSDPNLRRLLEAARASATPSHYALLRRTSGATLSEQLDASWTSRGRGRGKPAAGDWDRVQQRLNLTALLVDANRASALKALGVKIIWYDAHNELPSMLTELGRW